eukprot:2113176-Amphidinium_carterae.2
MVTYHKFVAQTGSGAQREWIHNVQSGANATASKQGHHFQFVGQFSPVVLNNSTKIRNKAQTVED